MKIKFSTAHCFMFCSLLVMTFSCHSFKYAKTNRMYHARSKELNKGLMTNPSNQIIDSLTKADKWVGTTNFDLRKPNFVIIHHTAQNSCEETLRTFTLERTKVSAHYVICRNGTIHHMLNDYFRAWHGGISNWGNATDINSSSIGIELDNNGYEAFDTAQINSLMALLDRLKKTYQIPQDHFIGHSDIAPTRKVDPNIQFPWQLLASNGYGVWFNPDATIPLPQSISVPFALAMVGYNMNDTMASIRAFKRHFRADSSSIVTDDDKSVLAQLINKKFKK